MELGTEIIGRYGAMFPEEIGEVVMIGNFPPEIKVMENPTSAQLAVQEAWLGK